MTSASVATAGIIGWVGLVVPHLARSLVGPDFARLLPAAALLGGGYLLLIDTLARTMAQVEIPLGILTAVIGTPFFIWLLASVSRLVVENPVMTLEGRDLTIGYPDRVVGTRSRRRLAEGRGAGAARPQWRRQDHAAQDAARAEDFKRIQLINNKMMSATMSAAVPDYGNIAETTGEIRKRAIRIWKYLQLPKVDVDEAAKESEHKQTQDAAQMKAALLSLDTCIMSFIQNPLFKNPEVLDAEQAEKARRDLEKIIVRSHLISKDAEKLRKVTEKLR